MGRSDERGTNHPDATWTFCVRGVEVHSRGGMHERRHARSFALASRGGSTDGSMGRSRWVHSGRPLEPVRPSTCWRTVVTDRHAMLHVVCRTSYRGRYRRAAALSRASRGLQPSGKAYNILTFKVLAGGVAGPTLSPPPPTPQQTRTDRAGGWRCLPLASGITMGDLRLMPWAMYLLEPTSSGARTIPRWHGHCA